MLEEEPHSSQAFLIPHLLNQNDPNNLVRDLGLTEKFKLLAFILKQWNMLQQGCQIYMYFRSRHTKLQNSFSVHNSLCDCSNINDLFHGHRFESNSDEWRHLLIQAKQV